MDYMDNYQMMWPYQCNSPMMEYPTERLEDMYPDIYRRVYPRVMQMCMMKDVPGNPEMYPNPSRAAVERMTDDIYRDVSAEMGYNEDDDSWGTMDDRQFAPYYGGPYYGGFYGYPGFGFGRRRFLRDLIGILLIRQLLGRRGFFY